MVKRILFYVIASIMVASCVQASVASELDEQVMASEAVSFFEQQGYSEESVLKLLQQNPAVAESLSLGSLESLASLNPVFLSLVVFVVTAFFLRSCGGTSCLKKNFRYKSHVELYNV